MDFTRRDFRLLLLGITLIACLALLALGVAAPRAQAASTGYDYYVTGDPADTVTTTQPGLLLAGGATDQDAAVQWWLRRAGHGDVVLIAASGKDDYSQYFWDMGQAVGGVDSVEMFVLGTRKAGFDPFFLKKLNEADAIYFDGGNQWLYYSYLVGTPAGAIISAAAQVKPEGGISAGLAIQGQFAYTAQNGTITSDQALANPYHTHVTLVDDFLRMPWLSNVITDSHFVARDRMGRHVTFLARIVKDGWTTQARGIAVNEDNTVTVDENGHAMLCTAPARRTSPHRRHAAGVRQEQAADVQERLGVQAHRRRVVRPRLVDRQGRRHVQRLRRRRRHEFHAAGRQPVLTR